MTVATNPNTGEVVFLGPDGNWQPAKTAVNPETREMMAFDGQTWNPVQQPKGVIDKVDDAVRSIASGITFGWADEFAAKMDEFIGRGTYEQNVAKERARDAQIPVEIQLPGEIAGAVGTTVLTLPLGAIRAIAAVGTKLPQWMKFGTLGAVEGGLAGAGGATEGNRASGAATGAVIGGPVGAAAPTIVRGATSTVQGIKSALSPQAGAAADLGRAIVRDETTPAELVQRVTAQQADRPGVATVADVGGENVGGLVERIAQTPGAGRTQVVPALTQRQTQQAGRIAEDLRSLTGTSKTASQSIDETIAQRSAAADPLYDEAIQRPTWDAAGITEVARAFNNAVSTGFGKEVFESKAFKSMLQTEYGVDDVMAAPLMVVIDAWKKTADDLVSLALKKEGGKNKARVIDKMIDGVVDVVDTHNPAYAKARDAWAGPTKFLEAIEEGRDILSTKVSADELATRFAKLGESQQEAYRIGAISSIIGKMGNDGARLADMTKYLRSPEARAKIQAIMPTEEAAASWARRLDFEVGASELTGRSLGNSATARRLAEKEDAQGIVGDLVFEALKNGPSATAILGKILAAGPKWLRDTLRSRTDRELADLLLNPDRVQDLPTVLRRAASQQRGTVTVKSNASAATTAGGVTAATE